MGYCLGQQLFTQPPVFIPATSSVPVSVSSSNMSDPFPEIKSKKSLVAKYVTKPIWDKLSSLKTQTSGFTLAQAIACAVEFDNQHCGIYAGDWDSYKVFADVFDPLIQEYHGIAADAVHTSDMDVGKIRETLILLLQFTPPVSGLEDPLMDLDFLLASPRNRELELKNLCPRLLLT